LARSKQLSRFEMPKNARFWPISATKLPQNYHTTREFGRRSITQF
jgi:hypothetical protein